MRKKLGLALTALGVAIFGLASCGEIKLDEISTSVTTIMQQEEHVHDLEHHEGKPASCEEAGWEAYDTCKSCEYSTYTGIPALGHDFIDHVAQEETCEEVGWSAYQTCSRCEFTTLKYIPAKGHSFIEVKEKKATCTEIGWNAYQYCENCDYTTYEEIAATGHTVVIDKAAVVTCTEVGKTEGSHCNTCYTVFEAQEFTEALGHDFIHHEAKEETCEEVGWDAYDTCSRCEFTTLNYISAKGHSFIEVKEKKATCTEIGWNAYQYCANCDFTTYEEIAAKGHSLVEVAAKEETCEEIGWNAYQYCKKCDYTTYKEIAATGHDLEHHEGINPTCTVAGYKAYDTCKNCDYTTYEDLSRLSEEGVHTPIVKNIDGEETRICEVCGLVDNIPPTIEIVSPKEYLYYVNDKLYFKNVIKIEVTDNEPLINNQLETNIFTESFSIDISDDMGNVTHFEAENDNNGPRIYLSAASGVQGILYYLNSVILTVHDTSGVGVRRIYIHYSNKTVTLEYDEWIDKVEIDFNHSAYVTAEDNLGNITPKNCGLKIKILYTDENGDIKNQIYENDLGDDQMADIMTDDCTGYDKVEATNDKAGHYSYYYCPRCKCYFSVDPALIKIYGNSYTYYIGTEDDLALWLSESGEGYIPPLA